MLENLIVNDYSFSTYTNINDMLQFIDLINKKYTYQELTILPDIAYKYQGNLFGLFREMGIAPSLYLATMYINGYVNPTEYESNKFQFKMPVTPPMPS